MSFSINSFLLARVALPLATLMLDPPHYRSLLHVHVYHHLPPAPDLAFTTDNPKGRLALCRSRQIFPSILSNQQIVFDTNSTNRHEALEYRSVDIL